MKVKPCEYLNEETLKELELNSWSSVKERVTSQHLKTEYLGCDDLGRLYFRTTSGTIPGKWWRQQIEFKSLPDAVLMLNQKLTLRRKLVLKMVLEGDVKLWCSDDSFHYFFKYVAWVNGYGLQRETRRPKRNNVQQDKALCKHLLSCIYTIPSISDQILRDYKKKKILPDFRSRVKNKLRAETQE